MVAMFTIEITGNAPAQVQRLTQRLRHSTRLMHAVGAELDSMAQDAFSQQRSADGQPWQALSPATIHQRGLAANGGSMFTRSGLRVAARYRRGVAAASAASGILNHTSALMRTVRWQASASQVQMQAGPHPSGAAIHQFGGQAGRGHSVTIVPRPWWPIELHGSEAAFTSSGQKRVLAVLRSHLHI